MRGKVRVVDTSQRKASLFRRTLRLIVTHLSLSLLTYRMLNRTKINGDHDAA